MLITTVTSFNELRKGGVTTYLRFRKDPYVTTTLGNDWIANRNNVKEVDLSGSIFDSLGEGLLEL